MSERVNDDLLCVEVEAINDFADYVNGFGYGATIDEAIEDALTNIRDSYNDDTYEMNEWWAA